MKIKIIHNLGDRKGRPYKFFYSHKWLLQIRKVAVLGRSQGSFLQFLRTHKRKWPQIIIAIISCCLMAGCVSLNKSYVAQQKYGLTVTPNKPIGKKSAKILEIYYPEISSQFASANFVYRINELQYTSDYYNMFFVSPYEQIYKNELKYLQNSQLFQYTAGNTAPLQPDYLLKTYVSELYADYRNTTSPKAIITIQFVLIDIASPTHKIIFNKTLSRTETLQQKSTDALILAWNQELTSILRQITFAIQKNI